MECFDISNISTTHVVASMVCFRDGVPDKNCYRRYRVRTVEGQDDFASMAEVVRRRYSRILLGARDADPDTAEFSQENPAEALERVGHPERNHQSSSDGGIPLPNEEVTQRDPSTRSEERRVGKECRSRWSPSQERKKTTRRNSRNADRRPDC